jgi:hypothetical protein
MSLEYLPPAGLGLAAADLPRGRGWRAPEPPRWPFGGGLVDYMRPVRSLVQGLVWLRGRRAHAASAGAWRASSRAGRICSIMPTWCGMLGCSPATLSAGRWKQDDAPASGALWSAHMPHACACAAHTPRGRW